MTRSELDNFYNIEATRWGRVVGKDIPLSTEIATNDLARMYDEVMGVKTAVNETNPHLETMNKMFALQAIKQASDALKAFGVEIAKFLGEGVKRAGEAETIGVNLKNALIINKDNSIGKDLENVDTVMQKLKKSAQDIGLKTMFSDVQILQVMEHLAANGITSQTILDGGAKSVAYLAQATKSELQPTVETITAIMHSMGKTLREAFTDPKTGIFDSNKALMSVADTLTNIKLTTGESLQKIGSTMTFVGPIADELGASFKDTAVAVDILARAGIQGSQAGTAMRRMLTNLTPASNKAEDAMRQLKLIMGDGANVFFDATGKMKSLTEVQGLLHDSMEGLSDEQKILALRVIFGQYALQSMAKIVSTSKDEWGSYADKVTQSGTAMRISAEQMNTWEGKWDVMVENINIAKKQLGDPIKDMLKPVLDVVAELFAKFSNLSPEVKKTIAIIAAFAAGLAIIAGTVGSAIATIGLMNIGLGAMGLSLGGIAAAAAPVIAIIAGLAAVAVIIYAAWKTNFGGFRDYVTDVWNYVKPAFLSAATIIKDAVVGAVRAILDWWNKISPSIEGAVKNIIAVIRYFSPVWKALWEGVTGVIRAAWDLITGVIKGAWEIVSGIFDLFVHLFSGEWGKLWDDVKRIWRGVWDVIVAIFKGAWDAVVAVFSSYWHGLVGMFAKLWDEVRGVWDSFVTWLSKWWNVLILSVGTWVVNVVSAIVQPIVDMKNRLVDIWNEFKENPRQAFLDLVKFATDIVGALPAKAFEWGRNLVSSFIDGIKAMWSSLTSAVSSVAGVISDFLGVHSPTKEGPLSDLDRWMPNLVSTVTGGLSAGIPAIGEAASGIADALAKPLSGVGLSIASPSRGVLGAVAAELKSLEDEFKPKIDDLKRKAFNDNTLTNADRVDLINNIKTLQTEWDRQRDAVTKAFYGSKNAVTDANQAIVADTKKTWADNTSTVWTGTASIVQSLQSLKTQMGGAVNEMTTSTTEAWQALWTRIVALTKQAINEMNALVTSLSERMHVAGGDMITRLADGILGAIPRLNAAMNAVSASVRAPLGIESSSSFNMHASLADVGSGIVMGAAGGVSMGATNNRSSNVSVTVNYNGSGSQSDFNRFADVVVRKVGAVAI